MISTILLNLPRDSLVSPAICVCPLLVWLPFLTIDINHLFTLSPGSASEVVRQYADCNKIKRQFSVRLSQLPISQNLIITMIIFSRGAIKNSHEDIHVRIKMCVVLDSFDW